MSYSEIQFTSPAVVVYNLSEWYAKRKVDSKYCLQPFVTSVISYNDNISEMCLL